VSIYRRRSKGGKVKKRSGIEGSGRKGRREMKRTLLLRSGSLSERRRFGPKGTGSVRGGEAKTTRKKKNRPWKEASKQRELRP